MSKARGKPNRDVVVEQALKLLASKKRAPKVKELLGCLGRKAPKTLQEIRRLLATVRRRLESEYGKCVCSVSQTFYDPELGPNRTVIRQPFLKKPPESEEDAKRCLPCGSLPGRKPNKIAGLYFPREGKDDLVYQAFVVRYTEQGMLETKLNISRSESGMRQRILSRSSTPKKISRIWEDHFGEVFASIIERQIVNAVERLEKSLTDNGSKE